MISYLPNSGISSGAIYCECEHVMRQSSYPASRTAFAIATTDFTATSPMACILISSPAFAAFNPVSAAISSSISGSTTEPSSGYGSLIAAVRLSIVPSFMILRKFMRNRSSSYFSRAFSSAAILPSTAAGSSTWHVHPTNRCRYFPLALTLSIAA